MFVTVCNFNASEIFSWSQRDVGTGVGGVREGKELGPLLLFNPLRISVWGSKESIQYNRDLMDEP
jgi:hypothetical protein